MKNWTLTKSLFDEFLTVLDPDRHRAGRKYEALRIRLVKFFEWRAYQFPDDLADETLDRVVKKYTDGEMIEDYLNYAYGVARLVYLEAVKKEVREKAVVIKMPLRDESAEEDSSPMNCLEICLKKLSENNRSLILQYYNDDKQAKIDFRRKIAETLGISINALRIKALRIRNKLEECVFRCLKKGAV